DKAAFAYYDLDTADWQVESGKFTIELGASSRDIRLSKQIYVESTKADDFIVGPHTLLGDILKHPKLTSLALEHLASLQATDIVGDLDPENDDAPNMMESMLLNMPLRAAVNFTQGMYSKEMMMHTIQLFNDQLQENE